VRKENEKENIEKKRKKEGGVFRRPSPSFTVD
jgi:hypothetical protein